MMGGGMGVEGRGEDELQGELRTEGVGGEVDWSRGSDVSALCSQRTGVQNLEPRNGGFVGHIKVLKMGSGVTLNENFEENAEMVKVEHASSHFCQENTLEYDLALQWRQVSNGGRCRLCCCLFWGHREPWPWSVHVLETQACDRDGASLCTWP